MNWELGDLGSIPGTVPRRLEIQISDYAQVYGKTSELCDQRQVAEPLWASVSFSSVRWNDNGFYFSVSF